MSEPNSAIPSPAAALSAEQIRKLILEEPDRPVSSQPVPTPEWPSVDGLVYVRAISADQKDASETYLAPLVGKNGRLKPNTVGVRAYRVAQGACTAAGEPIFTVADLKVLGSKSLKPIDRLYDAITKISGIKNEAQAEEEEKNSDATTGEGSC